MDARQAADFVQRSATYWFARLEYAVQRGDLAGAAAAQRELMRLGYSVLPRPLASETEEGRGHDE